MSDFTREELTAVLASISNDWCEIDQHIEDTKGFPAQAYWIQQKEHLRSAYLKLKKLQEKI